MHVYLCVCVCVCLSCVFQHCYTCCSMYWCNAYVKYSNTYYYVCVYNTVVLYVETNFARMAIIKCVILFRHFLIEDASERLVHYRPCVTAGS